MNPPIQKDLPQDELLQRYTQAKAALPDGLPDTPSAAVRERIMSAAREQVNAINTVASRADSMPANGSKSLKNNLENQILHKEAANDSFWNIRALGSLAVMGLAGLLWWQFEHGTPEEQEAAKSAKPSAAVVAPAPAAAPAPAPAPAPAAVAAPPAPTPKAAFSSAPAAAKKALPPAPTTQTTAQASQATGDAMRKETPSKSSENKIAATDMSTPNSAAPTAAARSDTHTPTPAPAPEAARARMQESTPLIAAAPAPAARAAPLPQPPPPLPAAAPAVAPRAATPAPIAPQQNAFTRQTLLSAIEAKDALMLHQSLAQGISPNVIAPGGNPALHQAVIQRWAEGVRILLAAGADRNAKNSRGHTAADLALELNAQDIAELLAQPK